MKKPTEHALEITKEIMETLIQNFDVKDDLNQIKITILPIISNAIYQRDNQLLEMERFETLITLARTLDNTTIETVIKTLRYQLTVKPNEKISN